MNRKFQHHPDNVIIISNGINELMFKLEDFLKAEPDYKLPEGFIGREYFPDAVNRKGEPFIHHRLHTNSSEEFLSPEPWEEGDLYMSKLGRYVETIIRMP